jgi:hypothetical protein
MVTDLSNEIPLCNDWDSTTLRSPGQPTTPVPNVLDNSVPFTRGQSLAVAIPTTVIARTDSFIDNLIRVFLDTMENRETQPHAVSLAIFVANRPHAGDAEPVLRRESLSGPKLVAEGTSALATDCTGMGNEHPATPCHPPIRQVRGLDFRHQ